MNFEIIKGIQLPACDVELLTLGRLIAVPFRQNIREGEVLWLYPSQHLPDNLSLAQYYQPEYLTKAESAFYELQTYPIQLKVWARCEYHWRINSQQKHLLEKIAQSTVWKLEALEHIFEQYQVLKLLILRVYRLSNPCVVIGKTESGAFYWPQCEDVMAMNSDSDTPVISEASFYKRKALLVAGEVYPYQDLEALQLQLDQIGSRNLAANQLNDDIKIFLGWSSDKRVKQIKPDLAWIKTIAALGDRSIELDTGKSNYQAGTDFENVVRDSLEFLGFTIDYAHKGGPGGLDLFCSKPYPLVGECKAGKKIHKDTPIQLLNLGTRKLRDKELLEKVTKLIIGPGVPSDGVKDSAKVHGMAIMNPETLEKLVKLQNNYPNSVDLFKLKEYLKPGQSDDEVAKYIQQVEQEIKVRSYLIKIVKNRLEITGVENAGVEALHGAYYANPNPPQPLNLQEMHEILIELSSPLTGYLGRIKGDNLWRDRFYFLRDLFLDD